MNDTTSRHFAIGAVFASALLAGCSSGSTPSVGPGYTGSAGSNFYAIVPDAGARRPLNGPFTAVVLSTGLFSDPQHFFTTATLQDLGNGSTVPDVRWSVSDANVTIQPPSPDLYVTPPPNGLLLVGASYGTATLKATAGSSTTTMPLFYYPAAEVGCDLRAASGASFDPVSSPAPASTPLPDLYVTGPLPANPPPDCQMAGFNDPGASDYTLHVPYGATLATNGNDPQVPVAQGAQRAPEFPYVAASMWRRDFTSLPFAALSASLDTCPVAPPCARTPGNVLLLKTAAGRIVKFQIDDTIDSVVGHYEVSDLSGNFPY